MAISISEEIAGIQTAVTALQAQVAAPPTPTTDFLTPATQSQLDSLASGIGAPTSTSTPAPAAPASS